MSPTHLAELFTRDVGVPPRQYLLQVRIERAKHYLTQRSVPITALGLELGFSSSQHFAATFKRITGKTPRDFVRNSKHR
jgi:AraC family transcriptional regulator